MHLLVYGGVLTMRLSSSMVAKLQALLIKEFGASLSVEEAQEAGLKIVRYVYIKELDKQKKRSKQSVKDV